MKLWNKLNLQQLKLYIIVEFLCKHDYMINEANVQSFMRWEICINILDSTLILIETGICSSVLSGSSSSGCWLIWVSCWGGLVSFYLVWLGNWVGFKFGCQFSLLRCRVCKKEHNNVGENKVQFCYIKPL